MTQPTPYPQVQFDQLGLPKSLLSGIKKASYQRPTPIQQAAIGPALAGASGIAFSFCDPAGLPYLNDIERLTKFRSAHA